MARAVERLFSDEDQREVVQLLTEDCAERNPNCNDQDAGSLEDLRFQLLMLSEGHIEKLRDAVRAANEDWRDLRNARAVREYKRRLLGAALAPNAASDRVRHAQRLNVLCAFAAFTSLFILRLSDAPASWSFAAVLLVAAVQGAGLSHLKRSFRAQRVQRVATVLIGQLTFVGAPGCLGFLVAGFLRR
jgi:hypothetical protein